MDDAWLDDAWLDDAWRFAGIMIRNGFFCTLLQGKTLFVLPGPLCHDKLDCAEQRCLSFNSERNAMNLPAMSKQAFPERLCFE